MFTGIVEELAQIKTIIPKGDGLRFIVSSQLPNEGFKVGDSISLNGVCLTIVQNDNNNIYLDLVEETLNKSNLGGLNMGDYVNLERAMKVSDRFGGHIVQGHIETLGVIIEKKIKNDGAVLCVELDSECLRYCIPKGSITLDGVSLTIAKINTNILDIAIIPYTLNNTTN